MVNKKGRAKILILLGVICIALVCTCGMTVFAEDGGDNLIVAHITDLHYYPVYMSYPESADDYNESAFIRKSTGEMKLLSESGTNLRATLSALRDSGADILLVSGDLTSDGERQGLIDVANALRAFQNDMRVDNENFQVIVAPGNHDIANPRARDYSTVDGVETEYVSRSDFAKIFAGLGYPDMSAEEAKNYYTNKEFYNDSHLSDMPYNAVGQAYVHSQNSKNAEVTYLADSFDRALDKGELSYIMRIAGVTVLSLDTLNSDIQMTDNSESAINEVGGILHSNVIDWITAEIDKSIDDNLISLSHHNLLEHFTFEEGYMPDYVMSNWREAAELLSVIGVDYHFSGHIHASDIANRVDYDGRVIYDITTPSLVSYGAGYRVSNIRYYDNGDSDIYTSVKDIEGVNYASLFESGVLDKNKYSSEEYNGVLDYDLTISTVSEYAGIKMLDNVTEKMLSQFVGSKSLDLIKEIVRNMLSDLDPSDLQIGGATIDGEMLRPFFDSIKSNSDLLIDNVVAEINGKVLAGYEYNGANETFKGEDKKLYALIYESVMDMASIQVSKQGWDRYSLADAVMYAYTSYLSGSQVSAVEQLPVWFSRALDNIFDGTAIEDIKSILSNEYMPFFKTLLTTDIDLTKGISSADVMNIDGVLKLLGVTLQEFNIGEVYKKVALITGIDMGYGSVEELADGLLSDYLTEDVARVIGSSIGELLQSFAVDRSFDGARGSEYFVVYREGDTHSAYGKARTDLQPSIEDGRLPSMLNVTFGEDVATQKNLVWFTDVRADDQVIQYMEGNSPEDFDVSNTKEVSADSLTVTYTDTVSDLIRSGVTKEIARHSVSLNGLTENTSYVYRIGDRTRGWWSDIHTMTTGSTDPIQPFEVLLISDAMGIAERDFDATKAMLDNVGEVFGKDGYDFIINLGGSVNNGNNMDEWADLMNGSVFADTSTVFVGGGADDIAYSTDEKYTPSSDAVQTEYNSLELHTGIRRSYYSFDYSGVHFTVLDTGESLMIGSDQLLWLTEDLAESEAIHKIVLMHKGAYTAGKFGASGEAQMLRQTLTPIFSDNGVDLVLQGYDRVYSESEFINNSGEVVNNGYLPGNPIANNNGGVLYVGLGTAGMRYGDFIKNEQVPIYRGAAYQNPKLNNPTFGKLTFNGVDISYTGYQYNLSSGRIIKIIDIIPWWLQLIIGLSVAIIVVIIVAVIIVILKKNARRKMLAQRTAVNSSDAEVDDKHTDNA